MKQRKCSMLGCDIDANYDIDGEMLCAKHLDLYVKNLDAERAERQRHRQCQGLCRIPDCAGEIDTTYDGVHFCLEHWEEEVARVKALKASGDLCEWSGCHSEHTFQVEGLNLCNRHIDEQRDRKMYPETFLNIDYCNEQAQFIRSFPSISEEDDRSVRMAIHSLRADLFEIAALTLRAMSEVAR